MHISALSHLLPTCLHNCSLSAGMKWELSFKTAWAEYAEEQLREDKLLFPGKNYALSDFLVQ